MVDDCIGPYRIVREIAQDGIGQVFEAVDLLRKKRVAIKYLRPEASSQHDIEPRLYSEAETLALLNHPHIARLFGFVRRDDQLYLVMEFVEGESLQAILKRKGRLEPSVALAFFHEILSAVGFAHRLGVIHGDLKPSNIMVTKLGIVKVLDFAIAPILNDAESGRPRATSVRYMSPEQSTGEPVDARSDVYSLGILLYEMIVGKAPFDSATEEIIGNAKAGTTPLPPSALIPESPKWLDAFLLRALATSPSDRFPSIAAMSQAMTPPIGVKAEPALPARIQIRLRQSVQFLSSGCSSVSRSAIRWLGSLRVALAGVATNSRLKSALLAHSLGLALAANNPIIWTKHAARWSQHRIQRLSSAANAILAGSVNRLFGWCKKIFTAASETSWKRYAVLALLLGSVMIETFFFAGANTLLRPAKSTPNGSHVGVVDQLFAQIDDASLATETTNLAENEPPRVEKPRSPAAKNPEPRRAAAETAKHQPRASQRAASDRSRRLSVARPAPEKPIHRPALQESRASEPAFSRANSENHKVKLQLNVKWEN
jgi:serine/threonine protein kinase